MIEVIRAMAKYLLAAICLVVAIVKSIFNQTPNYKGMKKLLFAIMLLASIQSIAQDKNDSSYFGNYFAQTPKLGITLQGIPLTSSFTNRTIYFMGKDFSQNSILKITGDKEIWFKHSAFCSCKSCKRFTGMKFLMKF